MDTKRSESIANLAAALAVAQGQIATATKDNVAKVKSKSGAEFSYKYSTLDDIWSACRKPLSDNGLSVIQIPTNDEAGFFLETIIAHSSGEWISGILRLPIVADRMSELQAMGSAITYARRYMLGAMVGVATGDDDDGQQAAKSEHGRKMEDKKEKGMTLGKLLYNLNRPNINFEIRGFYKSEQDILACRPAGAELPPSDDIDGWRQLFADARDYALAQIAEKNGLAGVETTEEVSDGLTEQYPEIFGEQE